LGHARDLVIDERVDYWERSKLSGVLSSLGPYGRAVLVEASTATHLDSPTRRLAPIDALIASRDPAGLELGATFIARSEGPTWFRLWLLRSLLDCGYEPVPAQSIEQLVLAYQGDDLNTRTRIVAHTLTMSGEYEAAGWRLLGSNLTTLPRGDGLLSIISNLEDLGIRSVHVLERIVRNGDVPEELRAKALLALVSIAPELGSERLYLIEVGKFTDGTRRRLELTFSGMGLSEAFEKIEPLVRTQSSAYTAAGKYLQSNGARWGDVEMVLAGLSEGWALPGPTSPVDIDSWLAYPEFTSLIQAEVDNQRAWFARSVRAATASRVLSLLLPEEAADLMRTADSDYLQFWTLAAELIPSLEDLVRTECDELSSRIRSDPKLVPRYLEDSENPFVAISNHVSVLNAVATAIGDREWRSVSALIREYQTILESETGQALAAMASMRGRWSRPSAADGVLYLVQTLVVDGVDVACRQVADHRLIREHIAASEADGPYVFNGAALLILDDDTDASGPFYAGLACLVMGDAVAAELHIRRSAQLASSRQAAQGADTIRRTATRHGLDMALAERLAALLDDVVLVAGPGVPEAVGPESEGSVTPAQGSEDDSAAGDAASEENAAGQVGRVPLGEGE